MNSNPHIMKRCQQIAQLADLMAAKQFPDAKALALTIVKSIDLSIGGDSKLKDIDDRERSMTLDEAVAEIRLACQQCGSDNQFQARATIIGVLDSDIVQPDPLSEPNPKAGQGKADAIDVKAMNRQQAAGLFKLSLVELAAIAPTVKVNPVGFEDPMELADAILKAAGHMIPRPGIDPDADESQDSDDDDDDDLKGGQGSPQGGGSTPGSTPATKPAVTTPAAATSTAAASAATSTPVTAKPGDALDPATKPAGEPGGGQGSPQGVGTTPGSTSANDAGPKTGGATPAGQGNPKGSDGKPSAGKPGGHKSK